MIASLININIPPLHPNDTVAKALSWMDEFKVSHLPLIDKNGKLIGNISEAELIDSNAPEKTIGSLKLVLDRSYISNHQHYLDVLKIFSKSNLTVIPVIDKDEMFEGTISCLSVVQSLKEISMINEKGAIIALYLHEKDYMMTQIANIIETNNAKILGSYIVSSPDSAEIEVVLKINRSDIRDIIQTFERYQYKVNVMLDDKEGYQDDMHDRFNQFMNYLNI